MILTFIHRHRSALLYGLSLAVLLMLMKWLEYKFLIAQNAFEIYAGLIALVFTGLGIWLALKLSKPKVQTVIVEREVPVIVAQTSSDFVLNDAARIDLNLSHRELEVLQLMADGLSNQEIAARLFVSLNTVKTHSARVFEKMEVKRRTQAVEKARRLSLIP